MSAPAETNAHLAARLREAYRSAQMPVSGVEHSLALKEQGVEDRELDPEIPARARLRSFAGETPGRDCVITHVDGEADAAEQRSLHRLADVDPPVG
jgi:hypothetical protein